jgi:hypothetical protein
MPWGCPGIPVLVINQAHLSVAPDSLCLDARKSRKMQHNTDATALPRPVLSCVINLNRARQWLIAER